MKKRFKKLTKSGIMRNYIIGRWQISIFMAFPSYSTFNNFSVVIILNQNGTRYKATMLLLHF